ncbi:MAG: hypothetical protein HY884_08375 [Deltaproteobacteria bacterium]|nr:hypothetical protein [Deltaproteobacteria bacterium]
MQTNSTVNRLDPELLGASLKASEGAPIVGQDMAVESGNGMTLAIPMPIVSLDFTRL